MAEQCNARTRPLLLPSQPQTSEGVTAVPVQLQIQRIQQLLSGPAMSNLHTPQLVFDGATSVRIDNSGSANSTTGPYMLQCNLPSDKPNFLRLVTCTTVTSLVNSKLYSHMHDK